MLAPAFGFLQVKDREAYYTDLQLLRVTKKFQAVLKGDRGEKDKELVQKTEARVELMGRAHESKVVKSHLENKDNLDISSGVVLAQCMPRCKQCDALNDDRCHQTKY